MRKVQISAPRRSEIKHSLSLYLYASKTAPISFLPTLEIPRCAGMTWIDRLTGAQLSRLKTAFHCSAFQCTRWNRLHSRVHEPTACAAAKNLTCPRSAICSSVIVRSTWLSRKTWEFLCRTPTPSVFPVAHTPTQNAWPPNIEISLPACSYGARQHGPAEPTTTLQRVVRKTPWKKDGQFANRSVAMATLTSNIL